jgi:hypothetical protein
MRTALACLLIASAAHAQVPRPWALYDKGIRWEKSLDNALARAAKEGKPVLFHQLAGDMDKEGC